MIDFILRQVLALMAPVGFVWGCLLLLTLRLAWRRLWWLASGTFLVAAIIVLFGSTGFPGSLVQSLERPYAGVKIEELPAADAIVLLGGGSEPSRYEVAGMHLTNAGDRILMAMELARLGKAPTLVFGGAGMELDGELRLESQLVHRWMSVRSFTSAELIPLERCTNTRDEAVLVKALADQRGWKKVLLVTSANHMRRAVATFHTAGVSVTPAPCNFITEVSLSSAPPGIGVPSAGGFVKASIWLHEQIGWAMYRRRGWIDAAHAE